MQKTPYTLFIFEKSTVFWDTAADPWIPGNGVAAHRRNPRKRARAFRVTVVELTPSKQSPKQALKIDAKNITFFKTGLFEELFFTQGLSRCF